MQLMVVVSSACLTGLVDSSEDFFFFFGFFDVLACISIQGDAYDEHQGDDSWCGDSSGHSSGWA